MSVLNTEIDALTGGPANLAQYRGKAVLIINAASQCGLTPQYAALEKLQQHYAPRGFTVLGVPCNQFMGQEPGTAEEIATFCSTTYGTTFPMTQKTDVHGDTRHPLYTELIDTADAEGYTGEVRWNFEKFLIAPDGTVAARFAPQTNPDTEEITTAIEAVLPR
ncbi:glutathione peroxidase [Streptomyces syringium]|uniref:glutathione peroxidase n=1 Tax=Streptomyces syringium TaxID=76729 RepID=UPI0037D78C94